MRSDRARRRPRAALGALVNAVAGALFPRREPRPDDRRALADATDLHGVEAWMRGTAPRPPEPRLPPPAAWPL